MFEEEIATTRPRKKSFEQAYIKADVCIGCTKCIEVCPVDAIIGSAKQLHTVLSNECIGCRLCVAPCPVDCISMIAVPARAYDPAKAQQRFKARQQRLQKSTMLEEVAMTPLDIKKAYVQAAVARVKNKKLPGEEPGSS